MKKQLHETILYPDSSFPYIMYTASALEMIPAGRGFNDLHWHEDLQFTLVTKGNLVIQVNGVDHALETGQAIFINKGVLHVTTQLQQNGQYISFNFPEKLLAFYGDSILEKKYVLPYTNSFLLAYDIKGVAEWERKVLDNLWQLKAQFDTEKVWGWEYEVSIKTVQLWLNLVSNISLSSEEAPKYFKLQQERLQIMLTFIHLNYSHNLTLQAIAHSAHLSISECNRSFKRTTHMTAYEYLIQYRIKKSSELLVSTDYTISEIALKVGFNHVNHFIQSFKGYYKVTPGNFKKRQH